MKSYQVTFERDDTGRWVVEVPSVPGCFTQGRTIEQARERIREALGLFIGERAAASAELVRAAESDGREPRERLD